MRPAHTAFQRKHDRAGSDARPLRWKAPKTTARAIGLHVRSHRGPGVYPPSRSRRVRAVGTGRLCSTIRWPRALSGVLSEPRRLASHFRSITRRSRRSARRPSNTWRFAPERRSGFSLPAGRRGDATSADAILWLTFELYRASAIKHLGRMLLPDGCRPWMLALHPTADRMPESSLSQMISWCMETFGGARTLCCATPRQVDCAAAYGLSAHRGGLGEPVCILGTTAALSALFEYLRVSGARHRSGGRVAPDGYRRAQGPGPAAGARRGAGDGTALPRDPTRIRDQRIRDDGAVLPAIRRHAA